GKARPGASGDPAGAARLFGDGRGFHRYASWRPAWREFWYAAGRPEDGWHPGHTYRVAGINPLSETTSPRCEPTSPRIRAFCLLKTKTSSRTALSREDSTKERKTEGFHRGQRRSSAGTSVPSMVPLLA